jgi:hypothetical protein
MDITANKVTDFLRKDNQQTAASRLAKPTVAAYFSQSTAERIGLPVLDPL